MSEFVISTRYANALLSIAQEKNTFTEVRENISFVKNTLAGSKELRNVLSNPVIGSNVKAEILKEIFASNIGSEVNNFVKFIVNKGRENILFDICKRFESLSNDKLNQVNVSISSAIEMNSAQKEEIETKLAAIIKKKVIPSYKIDSGIIGGFKARYNDTVIDASIQHQLELLKKVLFQEDYLKN